MLCIDLLQIYIQPVLDMFKLSVPESLPFPGSSAGSRGGIRHTHRKNADSASSFSLLKKWEASGVIAVRNAGMMRSRAEAKRKDGKRSAVWMRRMAQDNEKGQVFCLLLPFLLTRVSKTTKWNSALAARSVPFVLGFSRPVGYSFSKVSVLQLDVINFTLKRKQRRPFWPSWPLISDHIHLVALFPVLCIMVLSNHFSANWCWQVVWICLKPS